jgi:hypothetical protein
MKASLLVLISLLGLGCLSEPRVVGARRALAKGTRVTLGDVMPLELAREAQPKGCIEVGRVARIIGSTLSRDVDLGEPITETDLLPTGLVLPARGDVMRQRRAGGPGSGGRPGRRRAIGWGRSIDGGSYRA